MKIHRQQYADNIHTAIESLIIKLELLTLESDQLRELWFSVEFWFLAGDQIQT